MLGAEPSAYSAGVGSGEAKSLTAARDRAMHRGQCSITSQLARGLMLNPHRGQFENSGREALYA